MDNRVLEIIIKAHDQASKEFEKISDKLDKTGKSISDVGSKLTMLGLPATVALGFATKSAIDFESSFAGVRKTVDASEAEFKNLEKNFRNISKVTPVAVTELNRIGEIAGQLGVRGVDNITKFTKTMADMAVSTDLTAEEASISMARIATVIGEPIKNIDRMGASIVRLGNNFATNEPAIAEFASRIAGAGKIAKLTTAEVLAISTAFSSVGIEAEAGGTAVQKVLLDLNKQGKTGIGEFTKFVDNLAQSGDKASQVLEDLGFADVRLQRAFLSLAGTGGELNRAIAESNKGWTENVALTDEASKRYATTASQIQIFKNNLNDIGIVLGTAILPAINSTLQAIKPLVEQFANFAQEHPKLVAGALALVAGLTVLGGILFVVGTAISSLSVFVGGLSAVFAFIVPIIGAVIGVIGLPLLLAIGAVVGAITLLTIAWRNNWFDIQGKTRAVVDWFMAHILPIIKNSFIGQIVQGLLYLKNNWESVWNGIKQTTLNVINFIKDLISNFRPTIKIGLDLPDIQGAWNNIRSTGRSLGIPGFAEGGFVGKTGLALVHQGEYVLSKDMLAGRQPIDAPINNYNSPVNITAYVNETSDIDTLAQRLSFYMKTSGRL